MHYLATIVPRSTIDQSWRRHGRLGGTAATIPFTLVGDVYTSRPLTPDQVIEAQKVPSIKLEVFGLLPVYESLRASPASVLAASGIALAVSGIVAPRRMDAP